MSRDLFDEAGGALLTRDKTKGRRPFVPTEEPAEPRQVLRGLIDLAGGLGLMAFIVIPIVQQGLMVRFNAPIWLVGLVFIIGFLVAGRGAFRIAGRA